MSRKRQESIRSLIQRYSNSEIPSLPAHGMDAGDGWTRVVAILRKALTSDRYRNTQAPVAWPIAPPTPPHSPASPWRPFSPALKSILKSVERVLDADHCKQGPLGDRLVAGIIFERPKWDKGERDFALMGLVTGYFSIPTTPRPDDVRYANWFIHAEPDRGQIDTLPCLQDGAEYPSVRKFCLESQSIAELTENPALQAARRYRLVETTRSANSQVSYLLNILVTIELIQLANDLSHRPTSSISNILLELNQQEFAKGHLRDHSWIPNINKTKRALENTLAIGEILASAFYLVCPPTCGTISPSLMSTQFGTKLLINPFFHANHLEESAEFIQNLPSRLSMLGCLVKRDPDEEDRHREGLCDLAEHLTNCSDPSERHLVKHHIRDFWCSSPVFIE
ncbi:hypothetical protein C8R47DRAFT_1084983 [Mycena vitilis]|nr:hypothetical protein C8R47DRAFT_1085116 [Mycena vitilis]KAJ6448562.1 hypothetical protein C8R47DRAFT_1084983 [Mycena vitilis]